MLTFTAIHKALLDGDTKTVMDILDSLSPEHQLKLIEGLPREQYTKAEQILDEYKQCEKYF